MLTYIDPVYRPPSEADSLILQVTIGCSYNRCSFCAMYRSKRYEERSIEEIKADIDYAAKEYPNIKRVFLADGDALNLNSNTLVEILDYLRTSFPNLERVSSYAMPKNLLQKSVEELKMLREKGLKMLYIGIESGSDLILRKVTKGANTKGIIEGCKKAKDADIIISCMLILGLGGKKYSTLHAIESAKIINIIEPDYLAALTLYLDDSIKDEFCSKFEEQFEMLSDQDVLEELKVMVQNINNKRKIIFRVNHASNPYPLKALLPDEKEELLRKIDTLLKSPELYRPRFLRGF
ncbi:MAG: radical SAM protein [Candidatus Nitrosocaldaceae archaeon]